jgi:hypothetical protein
MCFDTLSPFRRLSSPVQTLTQLYYTATKHQQPSNTPLSLIPLSSIHLLVEGQKRDHGGAAVGAVYVSSVILYTCGVNVPVVVSRTKGETKKKNEHFLKKPTSMLQINHRCGHRAGPRSRSRSPFWQFRDRPTVGFFGTGNSETAPHRGFLEVVIQRPTHTGFFGGVRQWSVPVTGNRSGPGGTEKKSTFFNQALQREEGRRHGKGTRVVCGQ